MKISAKHSKKPLNDQAPSMTIFIKLKAVASVTYGLWVTVLPRHHNAKQKKITAQIRFSADFLFLMRIKPNKYT